MKALIIALLLLFPTYQAFAQDDISEVEEELLEAESFAEETEASGEESEEGDDSGDTADTDIGSDEDEDVEALLNEEFDDEEEVAEDDAEEELGGEDAAGDEVAGEEPTEVEEVEEVESTEPEIAETPDTEVVEDIEEQPVEYAEESVVEDAPLFDEPDYAFESRLADIYVNFYNEPMSEEQWLQLVQNGQTETYDIQKGDNLWDISATIFGDGNFWPKVWSLNSKIQNPHLIEPNHKIQFVMGDENYAPSFSITENSEQQAGEPSGEVAQTEETQTEETQEDVSALLSGEEAEPKPTEEQYVASDSSGGEIEIPPPGVQSKPVLKDLPPSLPSLQGANEEIYDDAGISYGKRAVFTFKRAVDLNYIYVSEVPESEAKIVEVELGGETASPHQYVYIQSTNDEVEMGETYYAYESIGLLSHDSDVKTERRSGYSIRLLGEVEVLEKVKARYEGQNIYKAIVKKAIFPVKRGSMLKIGKIQKVELEQTMQPNNDTSAKIIGGKFSLSRNFFSEDSIVYLNQGSNAGLAVGDQLFIRENKVSRDEKSLIADNLRKIGRLQIAHVDKDIATAVVVEANKEIQLNDYVGD